MRKYFLLSAVALLAATTANATTDYAEVTAKATIEVAGTLECGDMNFGTIVVKSGRTESTTITMDENGASFDENHILSVTDDSISWCTSDYIDAEGSSFFGDTTVTLTGDNGTLSVDIIDYNYGDIYSKLTIPANVKAGTYTGTFTVTLTY